MVFMACYVGFSNMDTVSLVWFLLYKASFEGRIKWLLAENVATIAQGVQIIWRR